MPEDDRIEFPEDEDTSEITQAEAEANPDLLSTPSAAKEGVLDAEDPEGFAELEVAAAEALLAEEDPADESGGAAPISRHQRRALRLALTQKGIRETPPGSNVNIYSKYFGFGAQFWCADFVAWALDKTGKRGPRGPVGLSVSGGEHHPLGKAEREDPQPAPEGRHLHSQGR